MVPFHSEDAADEGGLLETARAADQIAEVSDRGERIRRFGFFGSGFVLLAFGTPAIISRDWGLLGVAAVVSGGILSACEFFFRKHDRVAEGLRGLAEERNLDP